MLSTSILYCNKIDENVLIGGPNCRAPSTATATTASSQNVSRRKTSLPGSSCLSNNSRYLKSIDSGAISVLSETASSSNVGSRRSYRVRYLGCHTCDHRSHRLDNGIAAYQKPLLDLYTSVLRRSVVLRSLYPSFAVLNQVADFSDHGIVIAERDRFHATKSQQGRQEPTRPNSSVSATSSQQKPIDTVVTKVITPLSNILLWAAVKFQHRSSIKKVKNSAIKRRQIGVAFVPLSCSDAVLDKNSFVTLNSKQRFLLGLPHPPLFACVLQKVNSAQRLECHLFVCLSSDDAVRMCNRMAELRQQSTSIGRLHIPLSGQMGSYSYQNSIQSSATSVVSQSRSSNYTFSDLSSNFTPKHYFSANSDIEEEVDDGVVCHKQPHQPQTFPNSSDQIDSFESSATSIQTVQNTSKLEQKQQAANGQELVNQSNSKNLKIKCDPRLYNRTKKISQQSAVAAVNHNQQSPGNNHRHHSHHQRAAAHSWTELSSLSSGIISIKSSEHRQSKSHHHHRHHHRLSPASSMLSAQRDYRFQSYKCPEDYVLPTEMSLNANNRKTSSSASSVVAIDSRVHSNTKILSSDMNSNSSSIVIQKGLVNDILVNRQRPIVSRSNGNIAAVVNSNGGVKQFSSASEELQNNRLFAKASAQASGHSVESDAPSRVSNTNHVISPLTNSPATETRHANEPNQRFFGDSLKASKSFGQLSVAKPLANDSITNDCRLSKTESNSKNVKSNGNSSAASSAVPLKQTFSTKPDGLQSHYKIAVNRQCQPLKIYHPEKSYSSSKLQSTISNSIFFDNEDDNVMNSANSHNGHLINNNHQAMPRSNSEDTLYYYERNCESIHKKTNDVLSRDPINKTLSVPNITKSTKRQTNDKNKINGREVVLYLPESTNLGVKGFNKSTPVEKWSTMIATNNSNDTPNGNSPENDCQLCSLDLDCEECCSFCHSIEQQNIRFCSDCALNEDDIALDESLLKNFSQENSSSSTVNGHPKPESNIPKLEKDGLYQYDMYMTNVPRIDATSSKFVASQNKSFFGRMRRISWRSIFGGRKNSAGSRLWTRIQNGSQRLKGSKRFAKKRALKEPANRIFLPEKNCSTENQAGVVNNYDECYLNANMLSKHNKQHKSTGDLKTNQLNNDHKDNNRKSPTESNNNSKEDHGGIDKTGTRKNKSDKPKLKSKPLNGVNSHVIVSLPSGNQLNGQSKHNNNYVDPADNVDSIKPFFLSHPIKLSASNGCISQVKSPSNGTAIVQNHILSMSSDSGMEEYDCHSSNENSPLGYSSRVIPDMSLIDYEKLRSKMFANCNKTDKTNGQQKDNASRRQQTRKDVKISRQDLPKKPLSHNHPNHRHQHQQQESNNKNILLKNIRPKSDQASHNGRQSTNGQWSNANLENELGYMP